MTQHLFTSESVSEGHPDKVCDQISDAILDEFLRSDPHSRCAVETLVTTNRVVLAGEVRGPEDISRERMSDIARDVIKSIGYDQEGFSWRTAEISCYIHEQSADIAQGVDASGDEGEGAGDQGLMFGYACTETPELMPAPISYAHKILKSLSLARQDGSASILGPDAKSQITVIYEGQKPVGVESVLVSSQHLPDAKPDEVRELIRHHVIDSLPEGWMCSEDKFYVNPTGIFVIGGPDGDAGLTGRKIIVDTYGGRAPHGGGAFSGKDSTKVDRSAAYAMRYLAKNIVAAGLATQCTLQVAYAIGIAQPLALYVNTHGTGNVDEQKLARVLQDMVDLSPKGIRTQLELNKPIYQRTASYGHFGRTPESDGGFSWERTDLADELKAAF